MYVQGVQGHNVHGPNVLCLNKSINIAEREIKSTRVQVYLSLDVSACNRSPAFVPEAFSGDAENKKGYQFPFTNTCTFPLFLSFCLVAYSCRVKLGQRYSTSQEEKPTFFSNQPTITSFKSLVCKWCRGSRKFCLMLSSREYFTSAICFIASPISTRAWAVNRN